MTDKHNIFKYNNFNDAKGGTEVMVEGLLKHIDNNLLSNFDIVVSYPPSNFRKGKNKSILWLHDLPNDPYLYNYLKDSRNQNNFDFFVFVSIWQKEMFRIYFDLPHEKCVVLKNCIEPRETNFNKWNQNVISGKIKLIYDSTPQRGLNILFEVFKELYKEYGNKIELNVFSSFDLYGENHKHRNEPFLELFEELKNTKGINYFGSVDHEMILSELVEQHIWCLPSIWEETSCISLLEALSAGCLCVHSNLAALPETSSNYSMMYKYTTDLNKHASSLYETLRGAIESVSVNSEAVKNHTMFQKSYIDSFYGWEMRTMEWNNFLKNN